MKAVVFHGVGDVRLDDVPEPEIEQPADAIVRVTRSAICGTDLHMLRGTLPGMRPGTILGHEGVGIVEGVGPEVRNLLPGDRVVIGSTIGCGACVYCRAGYFSQCDVANPHGSGAGTAFFGGPESSGPFHGMQAEFVRVPFANVTCVKLPPDISTDKAILVSDIFPTGYFAADLAEIAPGDTVAVFGCGPVGQFAIASARLHGAGRIFAIDRIASRLEMAREQGAEVIAFDTEDPVEVLKDATGGSGPDRVIDAVGVDASRARMGPARPDREAASEFDREQRRAAPHGEPGGERFRPGDAPSQVLNWAVRAVAKAGTIAIVGVYPESSRVFPIGEAMNRNLTIKMGNCPHRRYIPKLLDLIRSGVFDPTTVLTQQEQLTDAIEAYRLFDEHEPGWMKVALLPVTEGERATAGASGAERRH